MITNPPLNQNRTEGDLVNFSCEGEVTFVLQYLHPFPAGKSWKPVYQLVPRQCSHSQCDQHAGTWWLNLFTEKKLEELNRQFMNDKSTLCNFLFFKRISLRLNFL